MAEKRRYTVTLPDHVADAVEKRARPIGSTPTEYAADVVRWWFGQGCPPVTHDEQELIKRTTEMMSRIRPLPKDFDIWNLDSAMDYNLADEPVEKALVQLGLPNLFAHAKEHDKVRFTVAFDNHPTHWLVFNLFKGSENPDGNGVSLYAYSKTSIGRKQMTKKLDLIAVEMEANGPLKFSQIPAKSPATHLGVQK